MRKRERERKGEKEGEGEREECVDAASEVCGRTLRTDNRATHYIKKTAQTIRIPNTKKYMSSVFQTLLRPQSGLGSPQIGMNMYSLERLGMHGCIRKKRQRVFCFCFCFFTEAGNASTVSIKYMYNPDIDHLRFIYIYIQISNVAELIMKTQLSVSAFCS